MGLRRYKIPAYGTVELVELPAGIAEMASRRTAGLIQAACRASLEGRDGLLEIAVRSAYLQGASDMAVALERRATEPEYTI